MDQCPEAVYRLSAQGYTDILSSALKVLPHLANTPFKGRLPLVAASSNGQAETVKLLLEHGAVVDAHDRKENFALMAASLGSHTKVIAILLAHGAKIDLTSLANGKSALNAASEKGKLESVKTLLAHGADVESEDINGWSPVFVAAQNRHVEVVGHLLRHGANPDVKDMNGECPLISASAAGEIELVEALLVGGAQVDIVNGRGNSALHLASMKGFTQIVHMLLEYGADINLTTEFGHSALVSACFKGHVDIAWTLLHLGAKDPRLHALMTAIVLDQQEIVKLFLEFGDLAHPRAVEVASNVDRASLFNMGVAAVDKYTKTLPTASEPKPEEHSRMEELMDTNKLILETVNSFQFKSMVSRRAELMNQAPAKGKGSLKLPVLFREFKLLYLAADWQTIGALLDLPAVQLRAIKNENHLARNCMREMLEAWLNTIDPPPTWERLVEAVGVLHESKAQYLQNKFCIVQ